VSLTHGVVCIFAPYCTFQ